MSIKQKPLALPPVEEGREGGAAAAYVEPYKYKPISLEHFPTQGRSETPTEDKLINKTTMHMKKPNTIRVSQTQ